LEISISYPIQLSMIERSEKTGLPKKSKNPNLEEVGVTINEHLNYKI